MPNWFKFHLFCVCVGGSFLCVCWWKFFCVCVGGSFFVCVLVEVFAAGVISVFSTHCYFFDKIVGETCLFFRHFLSGLFKTSLVEVLTVRR